MASSGEATRDRSPRDGQTGDLSSSRGPAAGTPSPAGVSSNWSDDVDHLTQNFDEDPAASPTRPPFVPSAQDLAFSARGEVRRENPGRYSPQSFWAQAAASPYRARREGSRAAAHTRFEAASPAVRQRIHARIMEADQPLMAAKTDDEAVSFAIMEPLQLELRRVYGFGPQDARDYAGQGPRNGDYPASKDKFSVGQAHKSAYIKARDHLKIVIRQVIANGHCGGSEQQTARLALFFEGSFGPDNAAAFVRFHESSMDAAAAGWNGFTILRTLHRFIQSFCSTTEAADMQTRWESIKWNSQGALATMFDYESAKRDHDAVVILTAELDTSLKLLPLSADAVLQAVHKVAPAWALLSLSKDRERYNTFVKAFQNWELERPRGMSQVDKVAGRSLHSLTECSQLELVDVLGNLLAAGRETADMEASEAEAEVNNSVLCEFVEGDSKPLLKVLALRSLQTMYCHRCNGAYFKPKAKGEKPVGHLLPDCPMKPSPEEVDKKPRHLWSSNPANKLPPPHTHFKPGAPTYFQRPVQNRGVHALSMPDSAAGSLESVATHVEAERSWYEETLRASEARTLKLVQDLLSKEQLGTQASINVMSALAPSLGPNAAAVVSPALPPAAAGVNILANALPPAAPLMFGDNAPDGYRLVGYGLDGLTELWLHPADFEQLATPLQQGN